MIVMAKDWDKDVELDDDFEDVYPDELADSEEEPESTGEDFDEVSDVRPRPVRKIETVAEDPMADGEDDEDIYSGRYRREVSDKEMESRRKKRARARRGRIFLILVILLALGCIAALAARAFMRGNPGSFVSTTPAVEGTAPAGTEASGGESAAAQETEAAPAWTRDSNADVTKLVNEYYAALAAGDTAKLSEILDPSVTVNADQIARETQFIESYQDIGTYVTDGEKAGEYAAYISYAMKFKDIATAAPGLIPAYVRPDSEGKLRLLRYEDFDSSVSSFMGTVSNRPEVKQLVADVNAAFAQAQESDADLKTFIAALSSGEVPTEAAAETAAAEAAGSEDGSQAAGESAEAGAETEAPAGEEAPAESASETTTAPQGEETEFKEVDDIQYTTTQVKLRKKAVLDNETQDYTILTEGTWVHVIGVGENWCKVVTKNGTTGYVYKQYLTPDKPAGN